MGREISFNSFDQLSQVRDLFNSGDALDKKKNELADLTTIIDRCLEDLDKDTVHDLIFYLKAQGRVEDAFIDMVNVKREIKKLGSTGAQFKEDYEKAKGEWEKAKKELAAYQPTDNLTKLSPDEIDDSTPGHPTLKVIRQLNLGTLNQAKRELLLERLEKIAGVSSAQKKAA